MRRRLDKVGLIKSLIQDAMSKFRLSIIYYTLLYHTKHFHAAKLQIIFGITKDSRRYFWSFQFKVVLLPTIYPTYQHKYPIQRLTMAQNKDNHQQ